MRAVRRWAALVGFAAGALFRRRGKNLAALVALSVVTAAIASVVALTDSLRSEARRGMGAMPAITVSLLRAGRPALLDRARADALARIDGVASVRPRVWGYLFLEGLGANAVVAGVPASHARELVEPVVDGRAPSPDERGWTVLGEGLARALGLHPRDEVGLAAPGSAEVNLRVIGTFRRASALLTADVALMDDRDARNVLGMRDDEATDLAVDVNNPDEASVVARKISAELPGARVVERAALARAYELTYGARGGLVALALVPALLALLVLSWDRATGLSAEERREVGVLKAVGWSTGDIVAARMAEAGLLVATAGALGALGAYVFVYVLGAPALLRALLGWSALYPPFRLTPAADGTSLVVVAALTLVPYLAAAAIPAWRAAVIDPAEAMR